MSESLIGNLKNKITDRVSDIISNIPPKIVDTFSYVNSIGPSFSGPSFSGPSFSGPRSVTLNNLTSMLGITQNGPTGMNYQGFTGPTGASSSTSASSSTGPTGASGPTSVVATGTTVPMGATGATGPTGATCGTGTIEYTYINNNITYTGCTGIAPPEINAKNIASKIVDTIGNIFAFIISNGIYILIASLVANDMLVYSSGSRFIFFISTLIVTLMNPFILMVLYMYYIMKYVYSYYVNSVTNETDTKKQIIPKIYAVLPIMTYVKYDTAKADTTYKWRRFFYSLFFGLFTYPKDWSEFKDWPKEWPRIQNIIRKIIKPLSFEMKENAEFHNDALSKLEQEYIKKLDNSFKEYTSLTSEKTIFEEKTKKTKTRIHRNIFGEYDPSDIPTEIGTTTVIPETVIPALDKGLKKTIENNFENLLANHFK